MSEDYLKSVERLKGVPKKKKEKMKLDDSTEHTLIEPIHIYLRSLNHDTGNAFHSFSIVPSPINHCIESYWPNSAALSPVGQILL